jgi:hypothetical protein
LGLLGGFARLPDKIGVSPISSQFGKAAGGLDAAEHMI